MGWTMGYSAAVQRRIAGFWLSAAHADPVSASRAGGGWGGGGKDLNTYASK